MITQPDHAALAGRIMGRWVTRGFPDEPRRPSILRAIAEHDIGWREVDATPLIDEKSGQVLDFVSAPASVRQGVWPRAVEALADDPIVGALVAEHAVQVYGRFRPDAGWSEFFAKMTALRDEQAGRAGLSYAELSRHYFFVRAGDLISLTFCTGWLDAHAIDDHEIRLIGPNDVGIRPDPFDGATVPFEIAARALPNRAFSSAAQAAEVFRQAPLIGLTGTARGLRT
jgi:hypothetical protein